MFYTIQTTKTGDTYAKAIYDFADVKSAKANHFYFLSSCYANENLDYFLAEIIDADGNIVARETWYKPAETVEIPDETEEEIAE